MRLADFKILFIVLVIIFLCVIGTFSMVNHAYGHEGHGFTHMKGPSGPLIGMRQCPGSMTQLWFHDDNGDGVVDRCSQVFFNHEKIHIKPSTLRDGKCLCWEEE